MVGMEGSLANKDEAEKCRDMAKTFLQRGDREKAVRFFEKSLRLYPLPGVESMRDNAKVGWLMRFCCDFLFACMLSCLQGLRARKREYTKMKMKIFIVCCRSVTFEVR